MAKQGTPCNLLVLRGKITGSYGFSRLIQGGVEFPFQFCCGCLLTSNLVAEMVYPH